MTATGNTPAGLGNAAAAEWTKLRSVRSTLWSLLAAIAVTVGIGLLATGRVGGGARVSVAAGDLVTVALGGVTLGQLAICVFGTMAITSEYGTGAIRTSLAAVPARGRLLAAKATIVAATALVVGLATAALSLLLARVVLAARLGPSGEVAGLFDGGIPRSVVGAGLYLGMLAVFALGVGLLLRHSAAAITATVVVTLVVPPMLSLLGETGRQILAWWPTNAGMQLIWLDPVPGQLAPWAGYSVFATATAAVLGAGYALFTRRDA